MNRIIRPLKPEDKAVWQDLWTGYLEYYESEVTGDVYEATFERLLDSNRPAQNALLAVQDGIAVGLVHFIYHAHNWRIEDVCYLQDLYTDPSVRGTGVARDLINEVYKAADANGTPSVYWLTQDFNKTARRLYDQVAVLTPFVMYRR